MHYFFWFKTKYDITNSNFENESVNSRVKINEIQTSISYSTDQANSVKR